MTFCSVPVSDSSHPATTGSDPESESFSSHPDHFSSTSEAGPGPSKKKYKQSYSKDWEGQLSWLSSSSKGSEYGFCISCNKHLLCNKGGIRDLKWHGETEVHKKRVRSGAGQKCLLSTWSSTETMARKATRAEAILSNMLVEHNIPFLLMDHLPAVISMPFLIAR